MKTSSAYIFCLLLLLVTIVSCKKKDDTEDFASKFKYSIPEVKLTKSAKVNYMNVARRSMDNDQVVIINSWNDFSKSTSLVPSVKYNTQFLMLTKSELLVQ